MSSLSLNSWWSPDLSSKIGIIEQAELEYYIVRCYNSRSLYYNIFRKKYKKGDMIQIFVGSKYQYQYYYDSKYDKICIGMILERRKIFLNKILNLYGYEYIAIIGDEKWIVRGNKQNQFYKICNLSEVEGLEKAIDKLRF